MSKLRSYKGFKIKETIEDSTGDALFMIYTAEEYSYGEGLRTAEWEAGSLEEAKQFIDSY
ncbi:hypothetical protein NS115_03745 [Paenibacillus jamilae]|uniref:Uncharacterized protein n=1 Tax=Paenibacillus jamilae TaxID=114136 RepID=A0ACC4ZZ71_9BACL|nr:hypothetical protein [Paenibacillus jamilae]KTS84452.1 hypothetical protein NS115_03745 [Paenibacillus jamilae]